MRKNVKKLMIAGFIFLTLSLACLVFINELNNFGNNIGITAGVLSVSFSIIFFSLSAHIFGKGGHILVNDLVPGKEYILIDHISINGSKTFSLIGIPGDEKYLTVHGDDRLYALGPKQPFIIVKGEIRKLT